MNQNVEHEIKILNIDGARVEKRINELGGRQVLDDLTTMEWFDIRSPVNNLPKPHSQNKIVLQAVNLVLTNKKTLREQGVLLRLRRQGNVFDFTLKWKMSSEDSLIITNREISEPLDAYSAHSVRNELLESGFYVIAFHEKKRKSYILSVGEDDVRLDLDTWPSIPQYMEIEGENPASILKAISLLGVEKNEQSNLVAGDFFSKYGVDFFSNLSFNL